MCAVLNLSLLPESSDSNDDNTGAIIGAVVAGIVGTIIITLLVLMVFWCYCKLYKKKNKSGKIIYSWDCKTRHICTNYACSENSSYCS